MTSDFFDPSDPVIVGDPYAHYLRWRESDPIHRAHTRSPIFPEQWFLFRHADVAEAQRDPRLGRDWHRVTGVRSAAPALPEPLRRLVEMVDGWMLFVDPPLHGELRGAVSDAFRPRSLAPVEASLARRAETLLLETPGPGATIDLLAGFALPLTSHAIADLLGVPEPERPELLRVIRGLEPVFGGSRSELRGAARAALELSALFDRLIDTSDSGILARFAGTSGEARRRAIGTCIFLYGAGFATTVHGISNGALAFARHPDAWAALRDDESLLAAAVEEVLRFDPPIQRSQRFALEPVELGGHRLPRGALIVPVLGSANRDPAVFPDPERFDPKRGEAARAHTTFGGGIHSCLGAWLARLELRVAFAALARRFPELLLADETLEWREGAARGLRRLPLVTP